MDFLMNFLALVVTGVEMV